MGLLSSLNPFKSSPPPKPAETQQTQQTAPTTSTTPTDAQPANGANAQAPAAPPPAAEPARVPTEESKAGALARHTNDLGASLTKLRTELKNPFATTPKPVAETRTPRTAETETPKGDTTVRGKDPAQVYNAHGDKPFNLNDPAAVKDLITKSPQIDNNDKTTDDSVRCGGASMLNGMLLDGKPAQNADAISKTAEQKHFTLSSDERGALDSMRKGTLTPNQAAVTQELLLKLGKADGANMPNGQIRYTAGGLTPTGMAELGSSLRKNGAFANSKEVNFQSHVVQPITDPENRHWTVAVQDRQGNITTANSFPGNNGEGSVGTGTSTSARRGPNGNADPAFRADVTIDNRDDGKVRYGVTTRDIVNGQPSGNYANYWKETDAKTAPKFDEYSPETRDANWHPMPRNMSPSLVN